MRSTDITNVQLSEIALIAEQNRWLAQCDRDENTPMQPTKLSNGDEFTLDHLTFLVTVEHDYVMREPWLEHDGHGVVSDWLSRDKRPSERILSTTRRVNRYYDIAASIDIAKRDGWGIDPKLYPDNLTPNQVASIAVELDYQYCKSWCDNSWHWVYVQVTLLYTNGNKTNECESCGGFESTDYDGIDNMARGLAQQIADKFKGINLIAIPIRPAE